MRQKRKTMTQSEIADFRAFCRAASDAQLREIIRKEAVARRLDCMKIAQEVQSEREGR